MQLDGMVDKLQGGLSPQLRGSASCHATTYSDLDAMARQEVGPEVLEAVEEALVGLLETVPHAKNRAWGLSHHYHSSGEIGVDCQQCSGPFDLKNCCNTKQWKLWMPKTAFETSICTSSWNNTVHLSAGRDQTRLVSGADAGNFGKVLYKYHGII